MYFKNDLKGIRSLIVFIFFSTSINIFTEIYTPNFWYANEYNDYSLLTNNILPDNYNENRFCNKYNEKFIENGFRCRPISCYIDILRWQLFAGILFVMIKLICFLSIVFRMNKYKFLIQTTLTISSTLLSKLMFSSFFSLFIFIYYSLTAITSFSNSVIISWNWINVYGFLVIFCSFIQLSIVYLAFSHYNDLKQNLDESL